MNEIEHFLLINTITVTTWDIGDKLVEEYYHFKECLVQVLFKNRWRVFQN
jgi:hypothetical protein